MSNFEQRPLFCEKFSETFSKNHFPIGELCHSETPAIAPEKLSEASRITEITLNSHSHLAKSILAGMLMELSSNADQRWLCWVAERPLKPLLTAANTVPPLRILQVVSNPGSNENLCQIAGRALERGKSHTVALLLDRELSDGERDLLNRAATAGNAECLLIQLQD